MQIIADTLSQIEIGSPVTFSNATMFPLLNDTEDYSDYLTLDEAFTQGIATVTEISEAGSVPELNFVNTGDLPVLLMDGEELIGAKQNRILNLTILAAAHAELKIPVSCVERGRWSARSAAFQSGTSAQFAVGRANRVASVTSSLRSSGRPDSDQREVWEDIDRMTSDLKVASPTSAMADIYQSYSSNIDESSSKFSAVKAQVGAVFAINGDIIGFDLFDRASTLSKLLPKLVVAMHSKRCPKERLTCLRRQPKRPRESCSTRCRTLRGTASLQQAKAKMFGSRSPVCRRRRL